MNKLNSFFAVGLIALAGTGLVVMPVMAADTMPAPERTVASHPATNATKHVRADKMAHVEKVQQSLNTNGANLKVDGKWGPKTTAAVKDFQKAHGLKATGRLDKSTRAQLLKA
jgi:peptidoglycan hydrolase-like protein with peptidoglycan-binding domain